MVHEKLFGEPTLIIGIATAIISALIAFGIDVSTEQAEAVKGIISGVIIPIGGLFAIRSQVSPVVEVDDHAGE